MPGFATCCGSSGQRGGDTTGDALAQVNSSPGGRVAQRGWRALPLGPSTWLESRLHHCSYAALSPLPSLPPHPLGLQLLSVKLGEYLPLTAPEECSSGCAVLTC